uniref:L-lactate dehydrogenase B chain n=2 Tax=Sus scrofa TaxID=9823 RepID=A0A8D0J9I9_PIG
MVTLKEKPLALGAEEEARVPNNKIIVTGIERVGVACVFSILGKSLADELALADVLEEKLKVAMMPLQHESLCLQTPRFVADTECSVTARGKIVTIAGVSLQELNPEMRTQQWGKTGRKCVRWWLKVPVKSPPGLLHGMWLISWNPW